MAKEEIVEGLRRAVSKGETIENAVASFTNAGYSPEDIDDAVRVLNMPSAYQQQTQAIYQPQTQQQTQSLYQPQTAQQSQQQSQSQQKFLPAPSPSGVVQRVSGYGSRPPVQEGSAITIVLFILLLVLLGILAAVFLFKEELSSFFSNIFSSLL